MRNIFESSNTFLLCQTRWVPTFSSGCLLLLLLSFFSPKPISPIFFLPLKISHQTLDTENFPTNISTTLFPLNLLLQTFPMENFPSGHRGHSFQPGQWSPWSTWSIDGSDMPSALVLVKYISAISLPISKFENESVIRINCGAFQQRRADRKVKSF